MIFRFRRKRCCIYSASLILFAALILIVTIRNKYINVDLTFSNGCDSEFAVKFISELCKNFTRKAAYGQICESICKSKHLNATCIHHLRTVVIETNLDKQRVVLKWKKPQYQDSNMLNYYKEFFAVKKNKKVGHDEGLKQFILKQVESALGSSIYELPQHSTSLALKDLGVSFIKDPHELKSFIPLVGEDEYATLGFFQELKHFPKLHGYCGQTYAVEKLTPYSKYFPSLINRLDWKYRVKLALSFLDMIVEFESAKLGPLHHCDIQEGNFGITDDLKIKAIDTDLIFTDQRMKQILPQPNCTRNSECDFFDCISMCDVKKNKCTARKITNNFQVVCREIFRSKWPVGGLIEGRRPANVNPVLTTLLNDCSSNRFGYLEFKHHRVQSTLKVLRMVLTNELKKEKRRGFQLKSQVGSKSR